MSTPRTHSRRPVDTLDRPTVRRLANVPGSSPPSRPTERPTSRGAFAPALTTLLTTVMLGACGGGSGSGAAPEPSGNDSLSSTPSTGGSSSAPLPDFVATDLVSSTETTSGKRVVASVSVANVGEGAATVPDGWFIVSSTEDFSSGYVPYPVGLRSVGNSRTLAPGEERAFDVSTGGGSVEMRLQRYGTYYARLWINPDRSADFTNPEAFVTPSHASLESNYENNLSSTIAFERPPPETGPISGCEPDALEENDSLESAAAILLDTTYSFNPCDDEIDVVAVELAAGQVVELVMEGEATDVYRSVVAPDGAYLVRDAFSGNSIVRAESTGRYHVVFRQVPFAVSGAKMTSFSIRSLR